MQHHTKDKGDTGVGFVIADLMSKNIQVCIPISEHQPYDLVGIRSNGTTIKISVKYRKASEGTVDIQFKSVYSDSRGSHSEFTDKSCIDLMAIYCPDTQKVYYINPSNFNLAVSLRISPTKNNQTKGILFADSYLIP